MGPRTRSNPLALAVLTCLHEKPMHPYEVAQTLRTRAKHESIKLNYGSLYSVVDSLEKRGLIHAHEPEREGNRPERTVYELTKAGAAEMTSWLTDLIAVPEKEYLQFEAGLTLLASLPPDQGLALLKQRADNLGERIHTMRSELAAAKAQYNLARIHLVEAEYVEVLLKAELTWLRGLIKDIEGGTLEGIDEWRSYHASKNSSPKKQGGK